MHYVLLWSKGNFILWYKTFKYLIRFRKQLKGVLYSVALNKLSALYSVCAEDLGYSKLCKSGNNGILERFPNYRPYPDHVDLVSFPFETTTK